MKPEGMNFPVYRKYKNGRSFFKILSEREFEELRIVGKKHFVQTLVAKQLPEIQFIHDLLFNYREMALEIPEDEYIRATQAGKSG